MGATKLYLELDSRLIGSCGEAVIQTFESLFSSAVTIRDVKIELGPIRSEHVSAILPFGQSSLEGVIALSFPRNTLANLAVAFFRTSLDEIDEEMIFGTVSEITSIIFGLLKEKYNKSGFRFKSSFPMVVVGNHHSVYSTYPNNKLHLNFDSVHGEFSIEMAVASGRN